MNIIVTLNEFSLPVAEAIEATGANVRAVLDALNAELVASTVKASKCTSSVKVSHNTKGVATIRTKDGRVATRAATPLTRLAEINQWAIRGTELFVGMALELPQSIVTHLGAAKYKSATAPLPAEDAGEPEVAPEQADPDALVSTDEMNNAYNAVRR